ncbi:DUF3168 domain-containing protein [Amycolatopsis thailandensis]|uniref:tail completion protein gp17 n=1 Tax=Amycolatopsis thailandensis TaxID=589330 RepID=UPI003790A98D
MIVEHKAAIGALLAGVAPTPLHDTDVPDVPSYPYAVWRMTTGIGEGTKICGDTDTEVFYVYVTSVGMTADSAAIIADKARTLLVDQRPVVAGWKLDRLKRSTSIPIQADRDVTDPKTNRHPLYAVDTYTFTSRKD